MTFVSARPSLEFIDAGVSVGYRFSEDHNTLVFCENSSAKTDLLSKISAALSQEYEFEREEVLRVLQSDGCALGPEFKKPEGSFDLDQFTMQDDDQTVDLDQQVAEEWAQKLAPMSLKIQLQVTSTLGSPERVLDCGLIDLFYRDLAIVIQSSLWVELGQQFCVRFDFKDSQGVVGASVEAIPQGSWANELGPLPSGSVLSFVISPIDPAFYDRVLRSADTLSVDSMDFLLSARGE